MRHHDHVIDLVEGGEEVAAHVVVEHGTAGALVDVFLSRQRDHEDVPKRARLLEVHDV